MIAKQAFLLNVRRSALIGLLGMFATFTAHAAPIIFNMSGMFDKFDQIKGITLGQTTFSASYAFDPATGNSMSPDATTGTYRPFTLTLLVPDMGLALTGVPASTGVLEVRNNYLSGPPPGLAEDSFRSQGGFVTSSLPSTISQLQAQFSLTDPSASAFSGTGLPLALDLARFSGNMFQLNLIPTLFPPDSGSICDELGSSGQGCTANGTITSVALGSVPEPTTGALMLAGLGVLGLVRRQKIAQG